MAPAIGLGLGGLGHQGVFWGCGGVGGQRRGSGVLDGRVVARIEEALHVSGLGSGVRAGGNETAVETLGGGSTGGHGGERGAPEVGGTGGVAAGLLEAGGFGEDLGVAGEAGQGQTEPSFGLKHVLRAEGGTDGADEVAGACLIHGDGLEEGECVSGAANLGIGAGYGAAHGDVVGVVLRCGLEDLNPAEEVAIVQEQLGAADGEVGPEGGELIALASGEVGATIEGLKDGIELFVVAKVVEEPAVLKFKACGSGAAVEEIEVLHAVEVLGGLRGVSQGEIEAGFALLEFDVGLQLGADIRGDFVDLGEGLGVAVAGHEGEDQALPGVGGFGVGSVGGKLRAGGLQLGLRPRNGSSEGFGGGMDCGRRDVDYEVGWTEVGVRGAHTVARADLESGVDQTRPGVGSAGVAGNAA